LNSKGINLPLVINNQTVIGTVFFLEVYLLCKEL